MSAQTMTILGSVAAILAFILSNLPKDTPQYVGLVLGALNSGLIFFLGKTNTGTSQSTDVTLSVKPIAPPSRGAP